MSESNRASLLLPSHRLAGRYVIQRVLGQGGFAITYLAKDERNRYQPVAVKELFPGEMVTRTANTVKLKPGEAIRDFDYIRDQFLREGETICSFNHPNLIRGYSVFEENGTAYVAMSYESGSSLRHHLRIKGTFRVGPASIVNLLEGLLSGLDYVHRRDWLHCDMKPANVFLGRDFNPVILDFGAARHKIRQRLLDRSEFLVPYTPHYSPVEQDPENHLDFGPWTDIYQVGALIYRCLTGGKVPASADRLKEDLYVPLTEWFTSEEYSREFLDAIDWSLSVLPKDRPRKIADWRAALDPAIESMRTPLPGKQRNEGDRVSPRGNDPTPTRRKGGDGTPRERPSLSKHVKHLPFWMVTIFVILLLVVACLTALVLRDAGFLG